MNQLYLDDLDTLLAASRADTVLLIDPHQHLPSDWPGKDYRVTRLDADAALALDTEIRYDLAVVLQTVETLPYRRAINLLARLRDVNSRRLAAIVPIGDNWPDQTSHWRIDDLLGLGMSLLARYRIEDRALHLYHYTIDSYKPTPEWFNSRHWAHPENWQP